VLRQVEGSEKNPHTEFGEQYFRLDRFTDRIQRAVTILLGLQLEVSLSSSVLVPGDRFSATLRLHNGSDKSFPVEFVLPSEIDLISDSSVNRSILSSIGQYGALNQTFEFKLPQSTPLTLPHPPVLDTLIHYSANDGWSNKSSFDAPRRRFIAEARVGLGPFILPVRAAFPYDVAERFEISASPSIALIQDWSASRDMNVTVRIVDHSAAPLSCELWVVQEALLNRDYEPARLTFVRKDEELLVPLRLQVPLLKPPLSTDLLLELRRAAPAPPDPLVSTTIKVKTAGVGAGRLRAVGYISGADRSPALALAELGADPVPLSIRDLEVAGPESKLVQLHAILIARDAYSRQPELKALNQRLLDFVSRGGTLIVGPQNPPAAVPPSGTVGPFPYQIKLSADPISVGSAAINEAHSELLSAPNKITAADLEAWPVGCPVNIPKEWDSHYKCLIKEGAPASEPGGLLLACDYGKGRLVYVGFDWQNALDEMTPGAYKLLANLLHGAEKSGKSESPSESPVYGPTD
ncbi:MAG TPA: hypothetical protein VEZ90_01140, partial [Blastocatellia bacterium]|nr:hypothetical protein [Blastocatellia bacterium]